MSKENRGRHSLNSCFHIPTFEKSVNGELDEQCNNKHMQLQLQFHCPSTKYSCFVKILFVVFVFTLVGRPWVCLAQRPSNVFTIRSSIAYALRHSTQVLASKQEVVAARANKKKLISEFLPKLSANYMYKRLDEERVSGTPPTVISPENFYQFSATLHQPIFSGFSSLTQYKISSLGHDVARLLERQSRQGLILGVKKACFELLQTEKLEKVAHQAVTQLKAHAKVAKNFYEVGMIPRNDLLKAEVELANARQDLVVAENNVQLAMSRFNTLVKRPIDAPVSVEDVMAYEPFTRAYEECVEIAMRQRVEMRIADLEVEMAEKEVRLTRKDYYPSIDLRANYYKKGDSPKLEGGAGIPDSEEWDVVATASWDLWEWGKTHYGVKEKLSRLAQARLNRTEIADNIRQQIKDAFLGVKEAENNILAVRKAVEQAKENFRMSEERYKEQVATSTEVLDAQTLLTKTQTNHFNALSAFNISKAELDWAMGVEVAE
ncbi:MAG: TolC family protein [Desulfobacterales bacterium]|nr:TolC family protein [Desulfobacterales bacterium]